MLKLTAANIVHAINSLPKDISYNYINPQNTNTIQIVECVASEGPIRILREGKKATISTQMIWRYANSFIPSVPVNIDRALGASYNTRAALETLLAHTRQFYWCNPGRIEHTLDSVTIKKGHKHLVWLPNAPHQHATLVEHKLGSDQAISELPIQNVVYESLSFTNTPDISKVDLPIAIQKRHLQIQVALLEIGRQIGFRTWIAHNDKGFKYGTKFIGELDGVIPTLNSETVLMAYQNACTAANLIDCIWFKNGKLMPAVMEVEHSTGITSGLNRMKKFQEYAPSLADIRWVIVAADEDREKVIKKANEPQFLSLQARFFPYSAVEELHSICKRRNLSSKAVNENLIDCFMEKCVV